MQRLTKSDREYREKQHNERAKKIAKTITQNLYTYLCVAIPFLLIATIWTDFTLPKVGWGLLGDGILTVVLMVVGERLMVKVGTFGGKLDDEHTAAKARYKTARAEAKKRGIALMTPFCDWEIDQEFERARRARCSRIRVKYSTYTEMYEGKTLGQLKEMLPAEKAIAIDQINRMEPIELTPDILLYNCGRRQDRRDIPESGEDFEERKIVGKKGLLVSVITCLICVGLPLTWCGDVTVARVIYTIGKLAVLLYRMFKGYDDGAKAYHTIEVKYLDTKSEYLEEYVDFIDTKKYLQIANEYTDINRIMRQEASTDEKIPCIEPNQERAGDCDLGSQPNPLADAHRVCA